MSIISLNSYPPHMFSCFVPNNNNNNNNNKQLSYYSSSCSVIKHFRKKVLFSVSNSAEKTSTVNNETRKRHWKAGEYPLGSSSPNTFTVPDSNKDTSNTNRDCQNRNNDYAKLGRYQERNFSQNGEGNRYSERDSGNRNNGNRDSGNVGKYQERNFSQNSEGNRYTDRDSGNRNNGNRDSGRRDTGNVGRYQGREFSQSGKGNWKNRNRDSSKGGRYQERNFSQNGDGNRNRDGPRVGRNFSQNGNESRSFSRDSGRRDSGNRDNEDSDVPTHTRYPVGRGVRNMVKNVKKKMDRKNNAKAWANTVTESLAHLILVKQWENALQVFDMLREQPFYQPKEGTYMKLLVLLGRCGQPGRARQIFDTMLEEGLEPTPQLYTALLAAYCRSNFIDQAFSLLDKMKSLPLCQPDVYTYSILIKACVDSGRFDLVESLYSQMSERSIVPNTVTQNIVLSGYGKAGKFDEMEKVLSGMLASTSSEPDVWTMNTILGLFGNKGQIEMMEKWYEKFRNFGIEPETRTFNILIGAYGKKRMYDKMSSVMEYMRKLSFPWTTSTYNNVIEAFSDTGDAKNMEHTFDQMRAEGIKADTKTFCCLIRGYANASLFHKVIASAQLAGELEIPENASFYNAIIFACAKAEDLVEMERVYQRMKDKHCQADLTTYSVMMDLYRSLGMSDKVYDLEQEKLMIFAADEPQVDEAIDLET